MKSEQLSEHVSSGVIMNKGTLSLAALLLLLVGFPVAGMVYAGNHTTKPKKQREAEHRSYPDEHLFI